VAAVRHDKIVDTRAGESLAEIAHAGKGWLVSRLDVLIGFSKCSGKLIIGKSEIRGQRSDTTIKRDARKIYNTRDRRLRAKAGKCGIDRPRNRWVGIANGSVKVPNNSAEHGAHFRLEK
jgi:hypothetical protein